MSKHFCPELISVFRRTLQTGGLPEDRSNCPAFDARQDFYLLFQCIAGTVLAAKN